MSSQPIARLTLTDRLRREWYVTKVDFLAQDVPSGHRKERRRELRSDLTSAAADVGMTVPSATSARRRSWHISSSWPKAATSRTGGLG